MLLRTTLDGWTRKARKAFLLDVVPVSRAEARELHAAALRRKLPARDLWRRGDTIAALVLYREATILFARAFLLARDEKLTSAPIGSELFDRLCVSLGERGGVVPAELTRSRATLGDLAPGAIDGWTEEEVEDRTKDLEDVSNLLSGMVETRSPAGLRAARTLRIAVAALLALALVAGLLMAFLRPANLARGCKAKGSPTAFNTQPESTVDGLRVGQLGFHSDLVDSPWLVVDLGQRRSITRFEAYGRYDCCFDQSVPIALEVSKNGVSYDRIATRNEPFDAFEPWVYRPEQPRVARFIRYRTLRPSYLVLSEIEAYGR